jgi:hypothetical protein
MRLPLGAAWTCSAEAPAAAVTRLVLPPVHQQQHVLLRRRRWQRPCNAARLAHGASGSDLELEQALDCPAAAAAAAVVVEACSSSSIPLIAGARLPSTDARDWRELLLAVGGDIGPAIPAGVPPQLAYAAALDACVKLRLHNTGGKLAVHMDTTGMLTGGAATQACASNAIILLCARKLQDRALALYARLPGLGLRRDVPVYTALLKRLTHDAQWGDAQPVLEDMVVSAGAGD